jgi:hypothetical protein
MFAGIFTAFGGESKGIVGTSSANADVLNAAKNAISQNFIAISFLRRIDNLA